VRGGSISIGPWYLESEAIECRRRAAPLTSGVFGWLPVPTGRGIPLGLNLRRAIHPVLERVRRGCTASLRWQTQASKRLQSLQALISVCYATAKVR
jgi:hypothetical protein